MSVFCVSDLNPACQDTKGGASGGTIASMINMVKEAVNDPGLRRELKDPYSLCPPGHRFSIAQPDVKIAYDNVYGGWIAPSSWRVLTHGWCIALTL